MGNISLEQTQQQARALLDSRIESITALVKARQRVTGLKEQLADAEREDRRAYVRATKDGWSADELKKLGLDNAAAGRRRGRNGKATEATNHALQEIRPADSADS